jgi:hypothetical protein
MKIEHSNIIYNTEHFEDAESGSIGIKLFIIKDLCLTEVAKITFWDATGQFYLEISAKELPLLVIEDFIVEAKQQIPLE